jgi:hypothetical protein
MTISVTPDAKADFPTVASAQFAALEPSWAGIASATQLRCLLILGALFNRRLYVHDTQLADNPHLLNAYARRHDSILNFYTLITDLISNGIIVVGLRDGTYMYQTDDLLVCNSLGDLVESWEKRDASTSWVIDPSSQTRRTLVNDLDRMLNRDGARLVQYSYQSIKTNFMQQVRDSFGDQHSELFRMVTQRGLEFALAYEEITNRPWFSHSSIFSLLQVTGVPLGDPLVQIHGMFDEAAYAKWQKARLLACDWPEAPSKSPEVLLGNTSQSEQIDGKLLSERALAQQALRIIDGPGADLIASLTGEEVIELRGFADELFKLQEVFEEPAYGRATNFEEAIGNASAEYWDRICSYLRRTRPNMTRESTRIGIFLRRHLPAISRIAERFVTVGLSSVVKVALDVTPGVRTLSESSRDIIAQHISLDFVFFGKSEGLKQLQSSMPKRGWMAPDMRQLNTAPPTTSIES